MPNPNHAMVLHGGATPIEAARAERAAREQRQRSASQRLDGRTPPHDLDAEATVLGAILMNAADLTRVSDALRAEHFYSDANAVIYQAILDMVAAHQPVDVVSLSSWLRDRQTFQKIGGAPYMAQLTDATPAVFNVEHHARTVIEKWRLRRVIDICWRAAGGSYGDVGPSVQAWLEAIQAAITNIATERATDGATPIRTAAQAAYAKLHEAAKGAGRVLGIETGLYALDRVTGGLEVGTLTLVSAPTGGAKSALVGNIVLNCARELLLPDDRGARPPMGALIVAYEMPADEYALRFAYDISLAHNERVKQGEASRDEIAALNGSLEYVAKLPIAIDDRGERGEPVSVEMIEAETMRQRARMKREHGVDLKIVVVDILQLVNWKTLTGSRDGEYQGMNAVARRLREFARKVNVAVILTAHVHREKGTILGCPAVSTHAQHWWGIKLGALDGVQGTREASIEIKKLRGGRADISAALWFHGQHYRFSDHQYLPQRWATEEASS